MEVLLDCHGYAANALSCALLLPPEPPRDQVCVHLGRVSTILARGQGPYL